MSILINAHQLSMSFGARPLFNSISFGIETGERIGLIGPNGAGKSTLLKIIAGRLNQDSGKLSSQKGLRLGFLEQVPQFNESLTILETIEEGNDGLYDENYTQTLLSKLNLTPDGKISKLSGGWKKRVALARELCRKPDLLLLDEPTNHLDVESIQLIEELLKRAPFASLCVTHDRAFLQNVSSRILELDPRNPNGLLSVNGDYADYLEVKEQMIASSEAQEVRLKNTLRREVEWLRQGAKARTTKQQARIKRAEALGDTVSDLSARNLNRKVSLDFQSAEKQPKKLIEAKGISKSYNGKRVVPELDLLITPQTRLGLLGPNGAGKSTLIRMLLGQEESDTGTIVRSDQLQAIYFEQNRESLDPNLTLKETVCPTGDSVIFRGSSVHVRGYLSRFLFTSEQMQMRVGRLSGGEQSRLLIARLMLEEANLLILDEPTNDLDVATLDVLEEVLRDFPGGVVLVTHDRFFLDQVSEQILAFVPNPKGPRDLVKFEGLSQWSEWITKNKPAEVVHTRPINTQSQGQAGPKKKKISFKDQYELDHMEENIQKAEARLSFVETEKQGPGRSLADITTEMAMLHADIERMYARWAELEQMTRS